MNVSLQYTVEGLLCMLNQEQEFQARDCGVRCTLEFEVGLFDWNARKVHQSASKCSTQATLSCKIDVASTCAAKLSMGYLWSLTKNILSRLSRLCCNIEWRRRQDA
jgi:hypothetical protein